MDDRLRRLERRAAGGDPEATLELARLRISMGQIDVGLLVQAGPHAVRLLPKELKEGLLNALLIDASVERLAPELLEGGVLNVPPGMTGEMIPVGGWFPRHQRQDVCPRGHGIGPNSPFRFNNAGSLEEWTYAYAATPDTLIIHDDWDSQHMDTGISTTECLACWAKWPAGKVQG